MYAMLVILIYFSFFYNWIKMLLKKNFFFNTRLFLLVILKIFFIIKFLISSYTYSNLKM